MGEKSIFDAKKAKTSSDKKCMELIRNANNFIDFNMHFKVANDNFSIHSNNMLKRVYGDIDKTSNFTSLWRRVWSIFILIAISLCEVIMVAVIVLKVIFKDFDTAFAISAVTTLLVQIVGLATIVFKFLFNKTDNKDADTYLELLKLLSQYEQKSK